MRRRGWLWREVARCRLSYARSSPSGVGRRSAGRYGLAGVSRRPCLTEGQPVEGSRPRGARVGGASVERCQHRSYRWHPESPRLQRQPAGHRLTDRLVTRARLAPQPIVQPLHFRLTVPPLAGEVKAQPVERVAVRPRALVQSVELVIGSLLRRQRASVTVTTAFEPTHVVDRLLVRMTRPSAPLGAPRCRSAPTGRSGLPVRLPTG